MASGFEQSDGNHPLAVGVVMGALMKGLGESGYAVEPIQDGQNLTKNLLLTGPSGTKFIIEITPQEQYG